jgi:SAM-dependent methyltransferase
VPTILGEALAELPQPLHLVAAMLRRGHYHFGLFSHPSQSLDDAQEALAREVAEAVPRGARVLDVGCGLGGTARLLAARGHDVVGIDPCEEAIAFAGASSSSAARFAAARFETHRDEAGPFDALVLVEVLQHLAPLETTLRRALELLRPGGTLVIADMVNRSSLPWERVPFHAAGAVAARSRPCGFDCVGSADLTARIDATPRRLAELLNSSRSLLRRRLPGRRQLGAEIVELELQCRLLDEAFRNGDLGYELVALRRSLAG